MGSEPNQGRNDSFGSGHEPQRRNIYLGKQRAESQFFRQGQGSNAVIGNRFKIAEGKENTPKTWVRIWNEKLIKNNVKNLFLLLLIMFASFDVLAVGQNTIEKNNERIFVEKKVEKKKTMKVKLVRFIKRMKEEYRYLILGILGIGIGIGLIIIGSTYLTIRILELLFILLGGFVVFASFVAIVFILFAIWADKVGFS
jgi:hypothetical protein